MPRFPASLAGNSTSSAVPVDHGGGDGHARTRPPAGRPKWRGATRRSAPRPARTSQTGAQVVQGACPRIPEGETVNGIVRAAYLVGADGKVTDVTVTGKASRRRSRPSSASSRAASTHPPFATGNRSPCGGGASSTSPGLPGPDEAVGIAPGRLAGLVELFHVLAAQLDR